MEEHAAAPAANPQSLSDKVDSSKIPSPIQFDSLETEVEDDLGLGGDRVGEAASVKSMEIEIQQALEPLPPGFEAEAMGAEQHGCAVAVGEGVDYAGTHAGSAMK